MNANRWLVLVVWCSLAAALAGCGSQPAAPAKTEAPPAAEDTGPLVALDPTQVISGTQQVPGSPQMPGPPGTKPVAFNELVAFTPLELDPNLSFEDLSQRFTAARTSMKVLPCGNTELALLYRAIGKIGFRGSEDVAGLQEQWQSWIAADPKEPAPLIAHIDICIERAWQARGRGFASTVSPTQFAKFRELLQEGKQFADQAQATGVKDPELYAKLITLGMGLSLDRPQVEPWAQASQEQFPKYHPTYESFAQYLLPRWHGEPGDIERYAESLLKTIPGDDGLEAYARVIGIGSIADQDLLCHSDLDHATVLKGAKLLQARYPKSGKFIEYIANVAWRNFDQPLCVSLLPALQQMRAKKMLTMPRWMHERRFDQFINYCNTIPVPQKPEKMFWPSVAGTSSLVFIDNGQALVAASDTNPFYLRVFKTDDLSQPAGAIPMPDGLYFLHVDRLGRYLLAATKDGRSRALVIDLANPDRAPVSYTAPEQVRDWDLSADGSVAVALGITGTVEFWNPSTGAAIHRIEKLKFNGRPEFSQSLSPDGKVVALCTEDGHELRATSDGQVTQQLPYPGKQPTGQPELLFVVGFQPDGKLLGVGRPASGDQQQRCLFHFDPQTKQTRELCLINSRATTLGIHSDKFVILSEHKPNFTTLLTVIDLRTGKELKKIDGHPRKIFSASISPDGAKLATVDDTSIGRMWSLAP